MGMKKKIRNAGLIGLVSAMPLVSGCLAAALIYSAETVAESNVEAARIRAGQNVVQSNYDMRNRPFGDIPLEQFDMNEVWQAKMRQPGGIMYVYEKGLFYQGAERDILLPYLRITSFQLTEHFFNDHVALQTEDLGAIGLLFRGKGGRIFAGKIGPLIEERKTLYKAYKELDEMQAEEKARKLRNVFGDGKVQGQRGAEEAYQKAREEARRLAEEAARKAAERERKKEK
ncbi:MAG: hypothetical protein AABW80_04045 [Nanoarchaeota archaeon]